MYRALSTLNTMTEVPLSKAPIPQLLPGRISVNGCLLLRVCVHGVCVCVHCCVCTFNGLIVDHSEHGSPFLAVCHVTFSFISLLFFTFSYF